MVYLLQKTIKGHVYLYLAENAWVNGQSKRIRQKYLGPEEHWAELNLSGILKKGEVPADTDTVEFGASAALLKIAEEIDLVGIIDKVAGKIRHQNLTIGQYLTIAAINRCVKPSSKSRLGHWFSKDWLATRFAIDPKVLNAKTYWNHFQYLALDPAGTGMEAKNTEDIAGEKEFTGGVQLEEIVPMPSPIEEVEARVSKAVVDRFGLNLSGVLYDTTNFFTFSQGGRGKGSTLLRFGHSKENRNGNRLVAYWILCTRDSGVPLMHDTYPGNCQDAKVFKSVVPRVRKRLEALGGDPEDITLVFDNGNLSETGFNAIGEAELKYVASRRPSEHKKLLHVPPEKFVQAKMPNGKFVEYYLTSAKIYKVNCKLYVVLDPAAQKKRVAEFRLKLSRKIRAIRTFFKEEGRLDPATLAGKKGRGQMWLERGEVAKKVASIIGKAPFKKVISASVSGPEKLTPESEERFTLQLAVNVEARKSHEETLGKSILFTSQDDWSPEEVIWTFREKYVIEHAFERMKCPTSIAIRPMYHHADTCIRGHVFTCVLALLLQSILRLKLAQKGIFASYNQILDALSEIKLTRITPLVKMKPITKLNRTTGLANKLVKNLALKNFI